ncbi:DUF4434 domain-containing protein [Fulvivirgaceae bacterium BMA12]|uniref:DUF4434 domain-containing protein n=1 Tax=Agaribacillus aureus TaxID=3051825 RepID=A0ABT8L9R0_9BACT|nr:DUF4434 domain-containing protein [Fulvivirgaceae bacterium BMA12]
MSHKKLSITGTFLDEISHDINHQNWGEAEWEKDFSAMKSIGIDTVILIRAGYKRWITYPSSTLINQEGCYQPYQDLVAMFLRLSEQFDMQFYFGLYDSGNYWVNGAYEKESALNMKVIQEVWDQYGDSPSFGGWYFSHEINRSNPGIIEQYAVLGNFCKSLTDLPILISPYIDGKKALMAHESSLTKAGHISLEQHHREWDEILSQVKDAVDIVAFQDGHVDYHELLDFMKVNKQLCDKYGLAYWTNCESFDRDMPIKFLPIKWDKMRLKLEIAQAAGVNKAITFEFSHFMSPNSSFAQGRALFDRYKEYIDD